MKYVTNTFLTVALLGIVLSGCTRPGPGTESSQQQAEQVRLEDMKPAPSAQPEASGHGVDAKWLGVVWERSNPNMPLNTSQAITVQTLSFDLGNRLSGDAGCNNFMGDYSLHGETLNIGNLAATKMGCMDNQVASDEADYLRKLSAVKRLTWRGDVLVLSGDDFELTYQARP